MSKKYRICFLGYGKLSEIAKPVLENLEYEDTEVLLADCNVETLPATVDRALESGYEMFIAGSANAAEFRRYSYAHLVEISIGTVDYLVAIKKAMLLGTSPVIAAYSYGRAVDVSLLEELSGVSLETVIYEDSAELRSGLFSASGDVIIGASHANELAAEMGKKSVLLYPSENSVLNAVRRARNICMELDKDTQKTKTVQAIVNNAPIGFIVSDENGLITLFNRAARQYTQIGSAKIRGKSLSDILPALSPEDFICSDLREQDRRRLINGAMIRCVQSRIEDGKNILGVLTTLYPDNSRHRQQEELGGQQFAAHATWRDVIGNASSMKSAVRQANAYAGSDYPLVIAGEPGTGRDLISQCIHNGSLRAREPYLPVNTTSLSDRDAARILFGYEENGSVHPGLLELARKGTVVLHNLEASSFVVQSCLLEAVTQQRFLRIGGVVPVPFQARFVTILSDSDQTRNINPELLTSLSVLRLNMPPLRARKEDILPLFSFFITQEHDISHRRAQAVPTEVLELYSWPGNLFELSAVCKRYAFLLSQGANQTANARYLLLVQAIGEDALLQEILARYPALTRIGSSRREEVIPGIETIKRILKYNNEKIADRLAVSRTTLWRITKEKS